LSSTIAARRRALPYAEVALALKLMVGIPTIFMKSVAIWPDPLTWMVEPVLPLAAVELELIEIPLVSLLVKSPVK